MLSARRRVATLTGAATLPLVLALLAPTGAGSSASAAGETSARPVPANDSFFAYAGAEYTIDVLANDSTSVLSSGDLTLCGVTVDEQAGRVIYAGIDTDDPSLVFLETNRNADGQVSFTYDACQDGQRATSTVSVDIERPAPLRVTKKRNRRGRLVVHNPNPRRVVVLWGSNRNAQSDGRRGVPAGGSVVISVQRTRIAWLGYFRDRGVTVLTGDGTVSGIKKARR